MCELFAVASAHPVGLCCSLVEFDEHGGGSAPHADGWGLARYVGRDVLLPKEAQPAAHSELARWVRQHPMTSPVGPGGHAAIWRPAAGGRDGLRARLLRAAGHARVRVARGHARGGRARRDRAGVRPPHARLGPANFLHADAQLLFAHGDRRLHGSEGIRPPGLWRLALEPGAAPACGTMAGLELPAPGPAAPAVVAASVPLSADPRWQPLSQGEVVVVRQGAVVEATAAPRARA